MAGEIRDVLLRQLDTAWRLTSHHLQELTTDECLWCPAARGPHVRRNAEGVWVADWPEHERYDLGPPSIAWLTWHVGFWWSMVLDHSFGEGTLARDDVHWPGSGALAVAWITGLHEQWLRAATALSDQELAQPSRTHWPFRDRPFVDVVGWVNLELMKNAAELGYVRFLYAVREPI